MDTKANYVVVGIFVLLLTAIMIVGFVWLSGFSNHKAYQTYLVYARGGVTGLTMNSPVLFNGVRVGSVDKIELDASNPQFVKLYLKVESSTPIGQSTVATLIPQGITGLVYVGLEAQSASAARLQPEKGQPYAIIPYKKPLLTQLSEALPELTQNMGEIAGKFKKTFSDKNLMNISETLNHLNNITENLDKQSNNISSSMNSLNTLLKNGATSSQRFDKTLIQAEGTFNAIQQAANQLKKSTIQISLSVNNLNQQMMPSVEELVARLNDTSANLQQISQDLETNPAILIRGKQPPPLGPGEK